MRSSIAILILSFLYTQVIAQIPSIATQPSVAISSTGQQSGIAVNHNSGTANIPVPIHTLSEYDINMPVSISYQTGGIRVDQLASNVGLGWSLNAGGGIFREVRGLPDEHRSARNGYFSYGFYATSFVGNDCEDNNNDGYPDCQLDAEPDIFHYNIMGYTGKFFFDKNGVIVNEVQSDLKFSCEFYFNQGNYLGHNEPQLNSSAILESQRFILEWKVLFPDGGELILGKDFDNFAPYHQINVFTPYLEVQQTRYIKTHWIEGYSSSINDKLIDYQNCDHIFDQVTAWFPREYISPQGQKLNWEYEREDQIINTHQQISAQVTRGCSNKYNVDNIYQPEDSIISTRVFSGRVKKIIGKYSELVFDYIYDRDDVIDVAFQPKRLETITIFKLRNQSRSCFKKYEFKHDYFQSSAAGFDDIDLSLDLCNLAVDLKDKKRLKLSSINESSCNEELKFSTKFTYDESLPLPRRMSFSQDYWGYHNGEYRNRSLLPNTQISTNCSAFPDLNCPSTAADFVFFATNRNPDFASTKLGALEKIEYPNGEFLELQYELHSANLPINNEIQTFPVGGLRIKKVITSTDSKSYDYSHPTEFDVDLDYSGSLQICNDCSDPGADCDYTYDKREIFIPCENNLNVEWVYEQTSECVEENGNAQVCLHVEFENEDNTIHGLVFRCFNAGEIGTQSFDIDIQDFFNAGLVPGQNYTFTLFLVGSQNLYFSSKITFKSNVSYNAYTLSSSGKLISYPILITKPSNPVYNRFFQVDQYEKTCDYFLKPDLYIFYSGNQSLFRSINGNHIVYGDVREYYNDGDQGYTIYSYNTDTDIFQQQLVTNNANPYLPIVSGDSRLESLYLPPDFGSLISSQVFDNDGFPVSSLFFKYKTSIKKYEFEKIYDIERCNSNGITDSKKSEKFFYRSFKLLPQETISRVDRVNSISTISYDPTYRHHNPISTQVQDGNGNITKITTVKYAHELGRQDLIDRNCVSLPLETLVEGGAGGGSMIDVEISANGRILPANSYIARTDGSWKMVKSYIYDDNTGLLMESNSRTPKNTKYTWLDGLLVSTKYENMESSYEYDDLRRLTKKTDHTGVVTTYDSYDGLHRLQQKTTGNGRAVTTYDYFISETQDDYVETSTTYPNDNYDIQEKKARTYYDTKAREFKTILYNHSQSGADYVTTKEYDNGGRVVTACDPGSGGCTTTTYESSTLSRPLRVKPAGSTKEIVYSYGRNTQSFGGYNAGSLYRSTVVDENGNESSSFKDIFGRTIANRNALGDHTEYIYNIKDELLEVIPPGSYTGNTLLNYKYEYYTDGLLHKKYIPGRDNDCVYEYDPDTDVLVKETLHNGHELEFKYNENHPGFLEEVRLDSELIKEYIAYDTDLSTYRLAEERVKLLGQSDFLISTFQYDDLSRVISGTTDHLDGHSSYSSSYDDLGNVRSSTLNHIGVGGDPVAIDYTYDYDKGLRPTKTDATFPTIGTVVLSELEYLDNNWLASNTYGEGVQKINYGYTSRGWLDKINAVNSTYNSKDDPCDQFPPNDPPTDFDCNEFFADNGGGDGIIAFATLSISYNCEKISNQLPTSINIALAPEANPDNVQEMIVPLFGFSEDKETHVTDTQELFMAMEDGDQLESYINGLVEDCLGTAALSLSNQYANTAAISQASIAYATLPTGNNEYNIYGQEIFYDSGNDELEAEAQYNGNISWTKWRVRGEKQQAYGFGYDALNRLLFANYGNALEECNVQRRDWYDMQVKGYDARGNISGIVRNGRTNPDPTSPEWGVIDDLDFEYNGNQLTKTSDFAIKERGFKATQSTYAYKDGNLIMDGGNDITAVDYNFLDLPTKIKFKTGTLEITYDANGAKLKQKMTPDANSGGTAKETHYHGAIEYENGNRTSIHHESGRIVYNGMLPIETGFLNEYNEWSISDHLGNTRVRFVDKDGDGKIEQEPDAVDPITNEVVGSYHYYPFGMKWDGYKIDETDRNLSEQLGVKLKYQYNGIEQEDEIGSGLGLTTYRIHDPAVARWYQVDPKAEKFAAMSPYNSMGNNPISYSDPEGDEIFTAMAIGAVVGIVGNGFGSIQSGKGFFDGAGKAALWGAVGAAVSVGIGSAFGGTGGFWKEAGRAGAHALSNGIQSELQGGSFGQGLASGALSSSIGSLIGLAPLNDNDMAAAQIWGGAVSGGIGSKIAGGNFFQGATQGLIVGAFNHALHAGVVGDKGDPDPPETLEIDGVIYEVEYCLETGCITLHDTGMKLLEFEPRMITGTIDVGPGKVYKAYRTLKGLRKGELISMKEALKRFMKGKDIYASRATAKRIAKNASANGKVIKDSAHGRGYFDHFHDKLREFGHAFFGKAK